jgi:O-antigen/teichoic acid export membrane protein
MPIPEPGLPARTMPLRRFLPQGRFTRRLMMLSGGTVGGQALMVAVSPILTRLFTPEEFGVLAVYIAVAGILGSVMALRYEFAVPISRSEEEAATLVAIGLAATLALDALLVLAMALLNRPLAELLGMAGAAGLFWFLPLLLLLRGANVVLAYWSIRRGTFRLNAVSNFAMLATQALAQLGLGLLHGGGAAALVIGYTLGSVTRCAMLAAGVPRPDRALLRQVRGARMWALAKAHWRYPLLSGPSTLLQGFGQLLPALLVALLYGPAAAGLFGLGHRITGIPVRLLSEAASHVFLGEIARAEGPKLYRLFRRTSLRFLAVGVLGMAPLLVAGPMLFAFVFGEPWRDAGTMVQILVPLHLVRFVVIPVSQTLNVTGHQHLHFTASVLASLALALSFALGAWLDLPLLATILLYSIGSTAAFLFYFGATWYTAWRAAASQPAAVAPGSPAA